MAQKLRKHGKKLDKTSVGCHIDFTILLSMLKVNERIYELLHKKTNNMARQKQRRSNCKVDQPLCFTQG